MTADEYDRFSCYLDLLNYQKTEINDSISVLLGSSLPILEEGLLLCTFPLPCNLDEFKVRIRMILHETLVLEKFILTNENNTTAVIKCNITYDMKTFVSLPLFKFSSKEFKDDDTIHKQLNDLRFSFKVSKSHLFFQVMFRDGPSTGIEFHYNSTRDSFNISPEGWNYSKFVLKYGHNITSVKAVRALKALVGQTPVPGISQEPPTIDLASEPLGSAVSPLLTPRRGREPVPRHTARKHIFNDPDVKANARSRHSSDTVREETYTTRIARANGRIVSDIAHQMKFSLNTDVIEDLFTKNKHASWTTYRYGCLDLALKGLIPIIDNRIDIGDIQLNNDQAGAASEKSSTNKDTLSDGQFE
jgi:hypothetical protein